MAKERSLLVEPASAPADESRAGLSLAERGYRIFAPVYDLVFGASIHPGRRRTIGLLDPQPGDRVLEVCVGTGLSLPLYPAGVRVTGIDLSREMLERAAARVARQGLSQAESLLQMDAQHLAFPDASFDKVACMYALSGLPDPVRALKEMRRVCRPGGTIAVINHFRAGAPLLRVCAQLLSPLYRLLGYRADLEVKTLVEGLGAEPGGIHPANLFDYNTILVWRN